ncbi:MAG: hypothetical protein U0271_30850 [Polyangiaceae bacterium]
MLQRVLTLGLIAAMTACAGGAPNEGAASSSGAASSGTASSATSASIGPSSASAHAEPAARPTLSDRVVFVDAARARERLGAEDEFTRTLGDFDRSARVGSAAPVTDKAFREFAAKQALDWPEAAKANWRDAVGRLSKAVEGLALELPPEVELIMTTGHEEFDAPHTRGPAIVVPESTVRTTKDPFGLLAHELFHVLSRHQPKLRERLYPILGFHKIKPVAYPDKLAARRITNPDAPVFEYAITVERSGGAGKVDVVALYYSKYDVQATIRAGLMGSLSLDLLEVATGALLDVDATDYLARASLNTEYAIHPEETMADNFALLAALRAGRDVHPKRPDILAAVEAALR